MVTIIIPTLDKARAEKTAATAYGQSGIPSARLTVLVVEDHNGDGFTRTVNRGLAQSSGNVCLLNDDVGPFSDGWLSVLLVEMQRRERQRVWFAGPSGGCRTMPQNSGRWGDKRRPRIVSHLAAFCLLASREAVEALGELDEQFIHYGSDVDWQWRAKRDFGAVSLWVPRSYVGHEAHEGREPWYSMDNQRFDEIWKQGGNAR